MNTFERIQRSFTAYLTDRLGEVKRNSPDTMKGLAASILAIKSMGRTQWQNKDLRQFIFSYGFWTVLFYGIFISLAVTLLAPIALVMLFVAPGLLLQALLSIPHAAFEVADARNPNTLTSVFKEELRAADPAYAERLHVRTEALPAEQRDATATVSNRWVRAKKFVRRSLGLATIGIVPVVGPIAASLGQTFRIAESMGNSTLRPYFVAQGWNLQQRSAFVKQHRWEIVGFNLPFVIMGAIPVVGVVGGVLAQIAAAHLLLLLVPSSSPEAAAQTAAVHESVRQMENLGKTTLQTAAAGARKLGVDRLIDATGAAKKWDDLAANTTTQEARLSSTGQPIHTYEDIRALQQEVSSH